MSRASGFTARAQARFEAVLMDDTCTIRRLTGTVVDDFSGTSTPTYADVYTGKCRFQAARAEAQQHDAGQDYLLLLRLELQLPVSVTGVEVGDVVTCTASVSDPDLPGRTFRVHDLFHKTHPSARKVQITERTGS